MAEMGVELGPFTIRREQRGWISVAYRLSDNHLKTANQKQRAAAAQANELLRLHEQDDILEVFPRITYFHPEHFLQAKYGELTTIALEGFRFEKPTSDEEVQSILEDLPDGFIRNPDYGLGLVKECRPIIDRLRSIDSITTLAISKQRESSIDNDTYVLDYRTFSALRKAIRRTHLDALATATIDKHILA